MKRLHMSPGSESERFSAAMKKTLVKGANGELRLMHKAGNNDSENRLGIFSSREKAACDAKEQNFSDMFSGFLDIRFPLIINEQPETLSQANTLINEACGIAPMSVDEDFATVRRELQAQGHDGIAFGRWDIPEQILWFPIYPDSIYPQLSGPVDDNRAPWQIRMEEWTSKSELTIIGENFEIDGRGEEFKHLFDALECDGKDLPILARDAKGWEVRWLNTWEPEATMGLFDPAGQPSGFYTQGQLWIDESARGAGRSTMMIMATVDLLGAPPAENEEGMAYSRAGYNAHMAAYRMARKGAPPDVSIDSDNFEIVCVIPPSISKSMAECEEPGAVVPDF